MDYIDKCFIGLTMNTVQNGEESMEITSFKAIFGLFTNITEINE